LDDIQKSVTDELKGLPAEAFQHCYEQWKQRLRRSVAAQGNCFEFVKRIKFMLKRKSISLFFCLTTYTHFTKDLHFTALHSPFLTPLHF